MSGPFYLVNVSVYLGRQRGGRGLRLKKGIFHVFFVLNQEWYVFAS